MADVQAPGDSVRPAMSPGALELTPQTAADLLRHLNEARAMLRSVIVAEAAVLNGSINWTTRNNGPDRWSPILSEVCTRLQSVQDIAIGTARFHLPDWWTFVALAEAVDAALWHACGGGADALDRDELVTALRALVSLLDAALEHCADEGVPMRAKVH